MSKRNIVAVNDFFKLLKPSELAPVTQHVLFENITYDVLIAQTFPLHRSLYGRRQVEYYLSILRCTYLVQEATERTLVAAGDKVCVMGSEHAFLVRLGQLVKADWTAVFELKEGWIQSVSMMIYRWTVLESYSRTLSQTQPGGNSELQASAAIPPWRALGRDSTTERAPISPW